MTNESDIIIKKKKTPIHILISSTILLVVSVIGIMFYTTAGFYQLYDPHFLNNISDKLYTNLNVYVIMQSISHFGLLISALYILKLKKDGIYIYFISVFTLLAIESFIENEFILAHLVVGLLMGITISISYAKMQ